MTHLTHNACCSGFDLPPQLKAQHPSAVDDPWYIFDVAAMKLHGGQAMVGDMVLPPVFGTISDYFLAVGGARAGTQFHKHNDGDSVRTPCSRAPVPPASRKYPALSLGV